MDPGTRLGPYEVVAPLGAGGMGEVWLAEDTRLGRRVAIKVLPVEFAGDAERLARFEREARAAAALAHPHIATVYDIGAAGDIHYIVQELLEGRTLRDALAEGALPVSRALELGAEIAEALAAAHAAGIIHRDLKPANLFLTAQGHAKVLDFGLAKLTETHDALDDELTRSPTVLGTQAGQVMGTAGYMAPEQAAGGSIDHRADLFAFGCTLYEMVAGRRAFDGQNLPEVLHRLSNEEPRPLAEIDTTIPRELWRIVSKCLAKDPASRFQTAADLVIDLRALRTDVASGRIVAASTAAAARPRPAAATPWVLAAAAVAVASWSMTRPAAESADSLTYLTLASPPWIESPEPSEAYVAVSPDGRRIVYDPGTEEMYLYDLDRPGPPRPLPTTRGATNPMFSPDGVWLGYFAAGALHRLPLAGGNPELVGELGASNPGGRAWVEDDRILYVPSWPASVYALVAGVGASVAVPMADPTLGLSEPSLLPDGRILHSRWDRRWIVEVYDPATSERRGLVQGGHHARYVPTGHLVYAQENHLFGRRFDVATSTVGEAVVLFDDVSFDAGFGRSNYAFSAAGDLVYLSGPSTLERGLIRIDLSTGERTLISAPRRRYETAPRIAPDGRKIAVPILDPSGGLEVWVYDMASSALTVVGRRDGWDEVPFWLSASEVAWTSEECGCVVRRPADATSATTAWPVAPREGNWWGRDISAHGVALMFRSDVSGSEGLWTFGVDAADSGQPFLVGDEHRGGEDAAFSPDGAHIVYESSHSGRDEIYVRAYPRRRGVEDREWRISRDGGEEPRWLNDGRVVYRQGRRLVAQRVDASDLSRAASPTIVVEGVTPRAWDIAADGSYVVMFEDRDPPRLVLIRNWFAELERRVPR